VGHRWARHRGRAAAVHRIDLEVLGRPVVGEDPAAGFSALYAPHQSSSRPGRLRDSEAIVDGSPSSLQLSSRCFFGWQPTLTPASICGTPYARRVGLFNGVFVFCGLVESDEMYARVVAVVQVVEFFWCEWQVVVRVADWWAAPALFVSVLGPFVECHWSSSPVMVCRGGPGGLRLYTVPLRIARRSLAVVPPHTPCMSSACGKLSA
jgi:hypothetical protein